MRGPKLYLTTFAIKVPADSPHPRRDLDIRSRKCHDLTLLALDNCTFPSNALLRDSQFCTFQSSRQSWDLPRCEWQHSRPIVLPPLWNTGDDSTIVMMTNKTRSKDRVPYRVDQQV